MAAEKVCIVRIEIDGDAHGCRVILSDGKELDGLQRVAPCEVVANSFVSVQIDAVVCKSDADES